MIPEIGLFSLILALLCAFYQSIFSFSGGFFSDQRLIFSGKKASRAQVFFLSLAFLCLLWCYWVSDFSVANVFFNSHTQKSGFYKITGVWGNHEGSLLLWCLILSIFGGVFSFSRHTPSGDVFNALVLGCQGAISTCFLAFLLFTSSPFARLEMAPFEGRGLNPLLQDPALALHPPFLYTGYVGMSLIFSFSVAGLLQGRIGKDWARHIRPWILVTWTFLTIGITLGSFWAYYELGWGGFWFWDPVENASLMPWLVATAFIHCLRVVETRNRLKAWTVLLGILGFSFSLLGAFLVRSGILTSVHTFAVDQTRGLFILGILAIFTSTALGLYAWRAPLLTTPPSASFLNRENFLILNTVVFFSCLTAVCVGTVYPLILDTFWGIKISVGPPYFTKTFLPLIAVALLFLPFASFIPWKKKGKEEGYKTLVMILGLSFALGLIPFLITQRGPWIAPFIFGLGVWLILGTFFSAFKRKTFRKEKGMILAHAGVGVLILGILGATFGQQEGIYTVSPGETIKLADFSLRFIEEKKLEGPNYTAEQGAFILDGRMISPQEITAEKRTYFPSQQTTTEVGLAHFWFGDVYLVFADQSLEGKRNIRLLIHPFIALLWGGALLMALGGAYALFRK